MLAQQLHVLEMFSRVDQGVKNYAMSHLLELTPDILIRSLQAEMDKDETSHKPKDCKRDLTGSWKWVMAEIFMQCTTVRLALNI